MRRGVCRRYRERWRNLGCSKIITLSTQWQFFPLGQIRVWIMPKYCLAPLDQSPITLCMIDLFWHIVIVIYSDGIYISILIFLTQTHKKGELFFIIFFVWSKFQLAWKLTSYKRQKNWMEPSKILEFVFFSIFMRYLAIFSQDSRFGQSVEDKNRVTTSLKLW